MVLECCYYFGCNGVGKPEFMAFCLFYKEETSKHF